jgi:alpha/beta hydrolase family protein
VIAAGESQSAFRLTTYLDAVEPLTEGVYDGYFVYSRGDDGAALSQDPQPAIATPSPTLIRTDLTVPVMTFTTETDLITLGYLGARQPDTKKFRNWEVAGTSHADSYTLGVAGQDTGGPEGDAKLFGTMLQPPSSLYGGIISCDSPINAGPMTYALRASIDALNSWIARGAVPPRSPRLQTTGNAEAPFALDAGGNVKGGIRTPQVDVPVATLSGLGQSGTGFCGIFGTTKPFDVATLAARYPSHAAFVKAWNAASDKAVKAGSVVAADAAGMKAAAAGSTVGG